MASSDAVLSALPISSKRKGSAQGGVQGRCRDTVNARAEGGLTFAEYYSVLVQVPGSQCCCRFQCNLQGRGQHQFNVATDVEMRHCAAAVGEDLR